MHSQMKVVMVTLAILAAANVAAVAGNVDETALREYAAQKRPDRVEAETHRLQRLYPGWNVPSDLWTATTSGPDEDPLWDLYDSGNMNVLRQAIEERKSKQPGWKPSDDLLGKIAARQLRTEFLADTANGDWLAASRLAKANNLALSDDIEMQWAAAEAFARTENIARAVDIYRSILTNKEQQAKWAATVLKALVAVPMSEVEKLIAARQPGNELDAISVDITRARVVASLRGEPSKPIDPIKLTEFEEFIKKSTPDQGGLLAWYSFRSGNYDKALEWFKWSIARGGDAMIAHGLALTLIKLGFQQEAEDVAFAWHDQSPNNAVLFIDVLEKRLTQANPRPIDPARLARYAQVTVKLQSGEGAQALAWYSYNSCQFKPALEWFQRAAAWFPKETTIFGYAMTLQRLHLQREFLDTVNRYDGLFPSVAGLLFRDEFSRPPGACDRSTTSQVADGYLDQSSGERPPLQDDRGRFNQGLPSYSQDTAFILASRSTMRMAPRSEFPLPVAPENPLFLAGPAAIEGRSAGAVTGSRKEPRFDRPLIARRVVGAAPMPYERFNIALLPAWNGSVSASLPSAADRPPAVGTIWSQDASAIDRDPPNKGNLERSATGTNRFHP